MQLNICSNKLIWPEKNHQNTELDKQQDILLALYKQQDSHFQITGHDSCTSLLFKTSQADNAVNRIAVKCI